ncbi:MAG TPA: TetR/AcrR family transcriptional regulator [Acidimicrobiales bacterium]|nr:TetR/AcrR family transcriptional regulator [Acidimicrobiales bacterium]
MTATGSGPRGARARVRAEIITEILEAARQELSEVGPAGLSLRAVARNLGMVPSALYRYFPSRDDILTALIVESYEAVGRAAEEADAAARTGKGGESATMERWVAVAHAVRTWAHTHPREWALIYGTPVTDYEAPEGTVEAALRITSVITGIFADSTAGVADPGAPPRHILPAPAGLAAVVAPMEELLLPGRPPEVVAAVLIAWTHLMGIVSLELFGHFKGATTDFSATFDYTVRIIGDVGGLAATK